MAHFQREGGRFVGNALRQVGDGLFDQGLQWHVVNPPEFTEPHQLGGQEGERIFDADNWDWIDNQSVQKSLHADDANGQAAVRHNITGFTEVNHVFEQYTEEIGAHNTQWDLLCAK